MYSWSRVNDDDLYDFTDYHGNCYSQMVLGVGDRWFLFVYTKEELSLQVMCDIPVGQDGADNGCETI